MVAGHPQATADFTFQEGKEAKADKARSLEQLTSQEMRKVRKESFDKFMVHRSCLDAGVHVLVGVRQCQKV